ncbi:MAG: hypothetical protein ACNA7W_03415 [Pseudomonadales bacterium]
MTVRLSVTVGVLLQNGYHGSMQLAADRAERTLLGVNIGVLGRWLVVAISVLALAIHRRSWAQSWVQQDTL